ncbi:pyrimidine/purine nucleoside phosphorylase [Brevibacterium sp.]|uniref:pyrimidine/purine nucleoside phosphorylase n=1 Tax=Brevibacterium sp. TaxID=1701 RepID=UPI002810E6B5|nr:pyrimidine/purine nucleoside phosphorylase [Brevibacterium sp.]
MIGQNEYYDGQVRSLEFANEQGKFTVGVMEPGEWTFEAPTREWMILTRGSWDVQLPGRDDWKTFNEGESFQIEGDESFTVRISDTVAYLCPYT